jgi:hypothetical protein
MDAASLALSLVTAQAGNLQHAIATRVMKQNLDADKLVLKLLAPAPQSSSANLAAGIGGNLNISA